MIGSIAGDIIGSVYEWNNLKDKKFPLFQAASVFTDDTVLTCAVADSLLSGISYVEKFKEHYSLYPTVGYGPNFESWARSNSTDSYNSWGNGSAMRVSPIGFAFNSLAEVMGEAEKSAAITHNHPEGIKGAQATAAAIYLARNNCTKNEIKEYITKQFAYDLQPKISDIRPNYVFDVSCQGSVPIAIIAFLEAEDYEDAIRNAISVGGDSDTIACIAGGIAQAFFGIPDDIRQMAIRKLDERLRAIVVAFEKKYMNRDG
ncbi:ADP-ribosylglycohydrolase family protein [Sporomusa sp. KB1]|jgi:ADP-ribosylglycohydrolase|uniref:ADP-ribosylglycohydrolase family protein n=1 Tax=Sporomusa sp. KB1 TaxID=943346 RepID=UPI0011A15DAC|nr:ADP-ribosylglycohydrolase family protein [Sporomusa sp. KB1]TWH47814.1 ADP-ribosylglycohydrolase [Sporomusa sp. KB1]